MWLLSISFLILIAGRPNRAEDWRPPESIRLPSSIRTEGRITLEYPQEGARTQHQLLFGELIDGQRNRSKVSIGYAGLKLREYQTRLDGRTYTVDSSGRCQVGTNRWKLVPELDWFVRMLYSESELQTYLDSSEFHDIGPSALLRILLQSNEHLKTFYGGKVVHRNLDCHVAFARFNRNSSNVTLELYIPAESYLNQTTVPVFSVREKAVGGSLDTTYTIDYFNMEPIQSFQMEQLEVEFNLPLASGCSQHLPQSYAFSWNSGRSFTMQFHQNSAQQRISLAYDYQFNYLRRELQDKSVSIWDMNKDLLYHIDRTPRDLKSTDCSVSSVVDSKLGPSLRPYNNKATILIDLLGALNVAFVGYGRVRNLPCAIYETVLSEPPKLFALDAETKHRSCGQYDYIVQFHLLRSDSNIADWTPETSKLDRNFWPTRIVLYKRDKKSGQVAELDILEVFDFHWGLLGWDTKASDLFMAPECFEQEDEQVRVELAIHLDRYNLNADHRLIAHNKFKLEKDLLDDISSLLHLSRLHITEFELSLRPHDILLSMVVGDRKQVKKIVYTGESSLVDGTYSNRMIMPNLGEQTCVYLASLVTDISLVVHCPSQGPEVQSTCTAVFGQRSSSVRTPDKQVAGADSKGQAKSCQVYTFSEEAPPISALVRWKLWGDQLASHRLQFEAKKHDGTDMTINGSIQDFDVSRAPKLMSINHYKFSIDDVEGQNIRHFDTMKYNSVGDCAKVCSLDVDCRSYSYCGEGAVTGEMTNKLSAEEICVLSSLDIRGSQFEEKLTRTKTRPDNKVVVSDKPGSSYTLELASRCSIHERDYLDMYSLTDEVVSVGFETASQFRSEKSALECAKWSVDVEQQHPEHHVAMFAYCPRSNTCLMDEDLFAQLKGNQSSGMTTNDDVIESNAALPAELQCQVYRRKYQTYFHLSSKVVERNPMYQLDLNITAVEECARACWMRFGQICHSFDFCSPQHCTINIIPMEAFEDVIEQMTKKREYRTGCLHYERDLRLDKLRQEHLIGKHQVLVFGAMHRTFAKFLYSFLLICSLALSLVAGLTLSSSAHGIMTKSKTFNELTDCRFWSNRRPFDFRRLVSANLLTDSESEHNSSTSSAFNLICTGESSTIWLQEISQIERVVRDVGHCEANVAHHDVGRPPDLASI